MDDQLLPHGGRGEGRASLLSLTLPKYTSLNYTNLRKMESQDHLNIFTGNQAWISSIEVGLIMGSWRTHLGFLVKIYTRNCNLYKSIRRISQGIASFDVISFVNSYKETFRFLILQANFQFSFDAEISL